MHIWHKAVEFVLQDLKRAQSVGALRITNYAGNTFSCFSTIGEWRGDLVELACLNLKKAVFTGILCTF